MQILVIEDDKETAMNLVRGLQEKGYQAEATYDGLSGLEQATNERYDVLIVDRMLPKLEGLEIIRRLRAQGINTPALILSAMSEVDDTVEGLSAGGDDYLAKPFAFAELVARLEVLAKRNSVVSKLTTSLQVGELELDKLVRTVYREGNLISLQPREFQLLTCLMENAEQVVTRGMLLEQVWGYSFDPQTNVVDVHISRLRNKVDKGYRIRMITNVRGVGYTLKAKE